MEEYRREIKQISWIFAAIGWGCNLGIGLMAKSQKKI
jgi:hypothetical protein